MEWMSSGTTFTVSCASAVRLLPPDKVAAEPDVLARRLGRFTFKLYGSRAYLANRPMRPDMTLSGHHVIRYLAMPRAPGEEWLLQRGEGVRTALFASSVPVLTAPAVGAPLVYRMDGSNSEACWGSNPSNVAFSAK